MTKTLRFLLFALVLPLAGRAQLSADAGADTKLCIPYPFTNAPDTVRLSGGGTGGTVPFTYKWHVYAATGGEQLPAATYLNDSSIAQPVLLRSGQNSSMQAADRDSIVAVLWVTDAGNTTATDTTIVRYQRIIGCVLGYPVYTKNITDTIQITDTTLPGSACTENYGPLNFLYWTPGNTLVDSTERGPRSFTTKPYETIYTAIVQDAIGCIAANGELGIFNEPNAIAAVLLKDALHIYPQPALDVLSIDAGQVRLAGVVLYSMDGRMLDQIACGGGVKASFATNHLATGNYLLEVQGADGQVYRQLVAVRH